MVCNYELAYTKLMQHNGNAAAIFMIRYTKVVYMLYRKVKTYF